MILEVCIDSVESALAAQEGGAGRLELCADLASGGITPSGGMIKAVRGKTSIALHVMIRPRSGDFCYSALEFEVMKSDIITAKDLGADGVVFGILTPARSIDVRRSESLLSLARPMSVTFHRAFDECDDPWAAFNVLAGIGIDRVLSSGGRHGLLEGTKVLAELNAEDKLPRILAGGGITLENVQEVVRRTRVHEVHALSAVSAQTGSAEQSAGRFDSSRWIVESSRVRKMINLLLEAADTFQ